MYEKRFYRDTFKNNLVMFNVCVKETDLLIGCDENLEKQAYQQIVRVRKILNDYITLSPPFLTSLVPISDITEKDEVIERMLAAGKKADVGPFAAVAGMVAEYVGAALRQYSMNVFVENGGDIYFDSQKDRIIGIFAGNSPLSGQVNILLRKEKFPIGICTSSGTVGHSLSFGKADAAVILSKDTALADAVATATCNRIKNVSDIKKAIEWAYEIEGVSGAMAIMGDKLGAIGEIELV
ncbi:MAG: UPF0280 family protein [Clostridia bacterium]|nr:UPF0280 family protein [Clostridia bacterium]